MMNKYVALILLGLLMMGCSSIEDDNEVTERVNAGDRVPSFTVDVVTDGIISTFSTAQLTGETVIVFFNTTCPDCQRDLPKLNQYYLKHKNDKGFQMVAISRAEGEDTVAAYWKDNGLQIPYSAQSDRRIYELFASSIIPRIYFVSAKGIVTRVFIERFDEVD
ncbi:MAG: TlpA family protein disulfide reductase [Prevotella sp.]|nr:TlpA family protein disulfide reductase [Prevotella sp.]